MRTGMALLVLVSAALAGAAQQSVRRHLDKATEIQGISCTKGYAWFLPDGKLRRCTVSREIDFGEMHIPAGSIVQLHADGTPDFVQMARDTDVLGMECSGGGWLGVAAGPVVAFYPSGKVKVCFLAREQDVQGVPCSEGGFWSTAFGADPSVYLYESGKLKQCRLARDFKGGRRGDLFKQGQ